MIEAPRTVDIRDWLAPFLFLLCMRDRDLQGYELMGRLSDLGLDAVRPGEVYRMLRRAQAEGLVSSGREQVGYLLPRRRYGLTEPGRAHAVFLANALTSYGAEIDAFLGAYERLDAPGVNG
jgi:PadR family transcriptional regulator PadR